MILTDDHPPRPGGVSVIVARLASELATRGQQVSVYARYRPGLVPIAGTTLGTAWGPSFGRHGGALLAARALPALAAADRVLASTWPVATALSRLGLRYDVLAHGSDVTRPARDEGAFAHTWACASGRWAMSRFLAGGLAQRGVTARILPAPVPIAERPAPPGRGWVLVARATPLKGGDRFVRWVAHAKVQGTVVGDGPELAAWKGLAEALGASVRFVGAQAEATTRAIVREAALCVLAPRSEPDGSGAEGFGLSLVEAAGLGVPAVGCRTGGVPEAIGPGLLIDAPDAPEQAVAAISDWWTPERGAEAWAWARAQHGTARAVDLLETVASAP